MPSSRIEERKGIPPEVKIVLWEKRIQDLEGSDIFPHIAKRLVAEAREKIKELRAQSSLSYKEET
jgi:hypothetical protein